MYSDNILMSSLVHWMFGFRVKGSPSCHTDRSQKYRRYIKFWRISRHRP